jgi:predicted flap endonuclease-1-like 5' DNA nuclease
MALKTYEQWKRGDHSFIQEAMANADKLTKTAEKLGIEQISLESQRLSNEIPFNFKEEDWLKIKGIGPKLAKKLVENGPYMSIEEIGKVKGVRKTVLENIKTMIESSAIP